MREFCMCFMFMIFSVLMLIVSTIQDSLQHSHSVHALSIIFIYFIYLFYLSILRSWQADTPGSNIVFRFYGTTIKIAIWQRRDGMGVLHAHVDNNKKRIAKASGFFKGYTWAMEKNNTGNMCAECVVCV